MTGRITIEQFVALGSTNHAKLYGLLPRKGSLEVGADADLALWNPERRTTVTAALLHDNAGYTPYEGRQLRGWPETVISRGRVIVEGGRMHAERGSGRYLKRGTPAPIAAMKQRHQAPGARPPMFKRLRGMATDAQDS